MTEAAVEPKQIEGRVIEVARKEMRAAIEDLKSIRNRLLGVAGSIPPSARETSQADLEGDPDAETEIRTVIANGVQDCLDPLIADLGTAAEYQPGRMERDPPGGPDPQAPGAV